MRNISIFLLFIFASVTWSQNIEIQPPLQLAIQPLGQVPVVTVNIAQAGISAAMLTNMKTIVFNSVIKYNLSPATYDSFTLDVSNQMISTYQNYWSAACSDFALGDLYFTYYYQNWIWLSYAASKPALMAESPEFKAGARRTQTQDLMIPFLLSKRMNLGASLDKILRVGPGVSSTMESNLVNFAVQNASNYNLSLQTICTNCYQVAEAITISIQNYYGSQWATSVVKSGLGGTEIKCFNGYYLSLTLFSNGNFFNIFMGKTIPV